MFGYVKAYKPELRVKEFEMYKAIYCSICRDLGKKYGLVSRFFLSYDFTFLTLLYMSLTDGCVNTNRKRCVCNPLKKCNFVATENIPDMPLAAAQIMLYYKLLDNINDEGGIKVVFYKILKFFSKKGYISAANDFPELDKIFSQYFFKQNSIEKENIQDIDIAADPTAKMLSLLFGMCGNGADKRALERLGYCVGRWIYILDATADIKEDILKKRYNPLIEEVTGIENLNDYLCNKLSGTLNFCVTEAKSAFELINIMRFKNILGNIIYLGLEESQKQVFKDVLKSKKTKEK